MQPDYMRVKDVMACLDCSSSFAYKLIQKLNAELTKKGYITMSGRVPRAYFEERCYLSKKEV